MVLGIPANDEADELALRMLAEVLRHEGWAMRVLSAEMLSSEILAEVEQSDCALVCVGYLSNESWFQARQFCKRLRSTFPKLPVVIGCWGEERGETRQRETGGLADGIGRTLAESKNQVVQFAQLDPDTTPEPAEILDSSHPARSPRLASQQQ
jgi:hypothetical protein